MEEDTDIVDPEYKNIILDKEINNLICGKWCFVNENRKIILNKYNHRTELKEIKNNNKKITKEVLLNTLGYIPVFYFLDVLYGTREYYAGFYREIKKGIILLLYHIISGISGRETHKLIPYTTYYSL